MDDADRAFEHEDMMRRAAVQGARAGGRGLRPVGECYACDEEVAPGRLFCDADCAQEFERQRRLLANRRM